MSKGNEQLSDIKSKILTMLEESDTLDYSVKHTIPKRNGGGTIYVSSAVTDKPLFRVSFSAVEDFAAFRVSRGNLRDSCLHRAVIEDEGERKEELLRIVTQFIENADNGRDVTGTPILVEA